MLGHRSMMASEMAKGVYDQIQTGSKDAFCWFAVPTGSCHSFQCWSNEQEQHSCGRWQLPCLFSNSNNNNNDNNKASKDDGLHPQVYGLQGSCFCSAATADGNSCSSTASQAHHQAEQKSSLTHAVELLNSSISNSGNGNAVYEEDEFSKGSTASAQQQQKWQRQQLPSAAPRCPPAPKRPKPSIRLVPAVQLTSGMFLAAQ